MRITSIFSIWLISEINFFIFLLTLKIKNKKNKDELVLYFFIQRLARTVLVFSLILTSIIWCWTPIILLIMIIKMGLAPFHNWYLNILNNLSWRSLWILTIWMKILYLKISSLLFNSLIILFSLINICFRIINLIKEKIIKTFIGISSLFNMGWILISLDYNYIWFLYLGFYRLNLIILITLIKKLNIVFIYPKTTHSTTHLKLIILVILIFMIGVPPFSGFFLKLIIIINLITYASVISIRILILTIVFIYYYLIIYFIFYSGTQPNLNFKFSLKRINFSTIIFLNLTIFTPMIILFLIYYLNNKLKIQPFK